MLLLFHIGMAKAGSTALQQTLASCRPILLKHGVLYPAATINHNLLAAGLSPPGQLPRQYEASYGGQPKKLRADFQTFVAQIRNEIAFYKPSVIILSSEHWFSPSLVLLDGPLTAIAKLLRSICEDIRIVAYLRRPSAVYLSGAQQELKGSAKLRRIGPVIYRRLIGAHERAFGRQVDLVAYDLSTLAAENIAADFVRRFVPELSDCVDELRVLRSNETMSAEMMAILQRYRLVYFPESDGLFNRECDLLLATLDAAADRTRLRSRPALRTNVAEFIDHASVDLLWLRDKRGIEFSDIDYGKIEEKMQRSPNSFIGASCRRHLPRQRGRSRATLCLNVSITCCKNHRPPRLTNKLKFIRTAQRLLPARFKGEG